MRRRRGGRGNGWRSFDFVKTQAEVGDSVPRHEEGQNVAGVTANPLAPIPSPGPAYLRRADRLGGLIHEYELAA